MSTTGRQVMERARDLAGTGLRTLWDDLLTFEVQPPAAVRGGRWLPYVPLVLAAFPLASFGVDQMTHTYGVPGDHAWIFAVVHAAAVPLALRRPMAAWWLSIVMGVVIAQAASPPVSAGAVWPWTFPGMFIHTGVLFLLALRLRARVAVDVLLISVLLTVLQTAVTPGAGSAYSSDVPAATFLFAVAVVVGGALRGRRVARTQLAEQETLTAEERARRTLLEERSRIARELHDVVAHHMSVISIQADAAPHRVPDPPQELTTSFATIRENAVEALTELRRILGVLRSEDPSAEAPDAPQPTLAHLEDLLENVRTAGLSVTSQVSGTPRQLPPGVALSGYRIVQEALSNALRHAPGTTVTVEVRYAAQGVHVRVLNTAPATAPQPSPGAGHGLLGMRERTAMLGGDLATGPTPGGGYEVAAFLPAPAGTASTSESAPA